MGTPKYTETFEQTIIDPSKESIDHHTKQIREVHSVDYGWFVPEPKIINNNDGTATLVYYLEQYYTQEEAQAKYDEMMMTQLEEKSQGHSM